MRKGMLLATGLLEIQLPVACKIEPQLPPPTFSGHCLNILRSRTWDQSFQQLSQGNARKVSESEDIKYKARPENPVVDNPQ